MGAGASMRRGGGQLHGTTTLGDDEGFGCGFVLRGGGAGAAVVVGPGGAAPGGADHKRGRRQREGHTAAADVAELCCVRVYEGK